MRCDEVALSLPWYLNGSLEEAERLQVSEHLRTCEACRQELDDTLWLSQAIAEHSTHSELIALTRDQHLPNRLAIERHVEICQSCREKLQLIELMTSVPEQTEHLPQSAQVPISPVSPAAVPAASSGVAPFWRSWALAATIVLALGTGVWFQQASSESPRSTKVVVLEKPIPIRNLEPDSQTFVVSSSEALLTLYYPLSLSQDLSRFIRFTATLHSVADPSRSIWQDVPWQPDDQNSFALVLSVEDLNVDEEYLLRLYGWEDGKATELETLPFSLRLVEG